jgi:hypothetical protein
MDEFRLKIKEELKHISGVPPRSRLSPTRLAKAWKLASFSLTNKR